MGSSSVYDLGTRPTIQVLGGWLKMLRWLHPSTGSCLNCVFFQMICPSKKCIAPLGSSSVPGTSWRRDHPKRWNKSSRLQWTHRCSTAPGAVQVMAGKQWKDSGHTRSIYQTWWTNNASKINEWMINDLLYSYNIYIYIYSNTILWVSIRLYKSVIWHALPKPPPCFPLFSG